MVAGRLQKLIFIMSEPLFAVCFAQHGMTVADDALLNLLRLLKERHYRFITPTPATHGRVLQRPDRQQARCLEDILGWSLPFEAGSIDPLIARYLRDANAVTEVNGLSRSLVRVSSLDNCLYLHSAFPTEGRDAAFFGPDSYRFADLITAELSDRALNSEKLIVDIGAGVGVGGIVAGRICPEAHVAMTEINPVALRFARLNVAAANVEATTLLTDRLEGVEGTIDLALANPPYIIDERRRLYRDGGGLHGGQVTIDMAGFILPRLADGGRLILYSGSAIIFGRDRIEARLRALAGEHGCQLRYRELDPDVFGEELERPAYADVDRIALIAAIFERS